MTDLMAKIQDRTAKVVVVGQGYVGLVVAMRASEAGFPVTGVEVNQTRASRLAAGDSFIEDISDDVLRAALDRGYTPTPSFEGAKDFDVAVISVPTPLAEGVPDLSYVESAAKQLGPWLTAGACVILESTTYPGTTSELLGPALERVSGLTAGVDFHLGYSPERIDPGNPSWGLHNTPKVVSGIDAASLAVVDAFFSAFVETTVPVSGCGEAELAKIVENTFRHVNIALVNELAIFAHELGIDVHEALDASGTKPFGFMKFTPGPGVGGHCLPIDPTYLSWRVKQHLGETFRFVELANEVNEHMPHYVVRRVTSLLNGRRLAVNGSRIVALGVSYKPDVGDARETPAVPVLRQLVELGADVTAVDPWIEPSDLDGLGVTHATDLGDELLAATDLVVILTNHTDFDYDRLVASGTPVLDTRNQITERVDHVHRL